MSKTQSGNWTIETCSTIGTGSLALSGAIDLQHTSFQQTILPGEIYYTILDGNNRESGLGTFDGNQTLVRTTVLNTLVNGVYNDANPNTIDLTGQSVVANTFNASSYRELFDHLTIEGNPHNVIASEVSYDFNSDPHSNATNVQLAIEELNVGVENRVASISGVIDGGFLTGAGNQFSITSGLGEIFDSYSVVSHSNITDVVWNAQNNVMLQTNDTSGATRIFINSGGLVQQFTSKPTPDILRDYILLGVIYYKDGVISDVVNTPAIIKQTATDLYDVLQQRIFISGLNVRAVDNELQTWVEEGTAFFPGANWYTNKQIPNNILLNQDGSNVSPVTLSSITLDGASQGDIIDYPLAYNPSGSTITNLTGNDATIHRLYRLGVNNPVYFMLYGQNLYNNTSSAKENLFQDNNNTVYPSIIDNMVLIAHIGVNDNALDFDNVNDAWIVSTISGSTTSSSTILTSHTVLSDKEVANQHPIESIGTSGNEQLRTTLDNKMVWRNKWASQQYERNDVVLDGDWTMVANKVTSERAAPQETGNPDTQPSTSLNWATNSFTGVVKMVHKYTTTTDGWFKQFRIRTAVWDLNTVTKITIINTSNGNSTVINNPILTTDGWTVIPIEGNPVPSGTIFEIRYEYYNSSLANNITGNWDSSVGVGNPALSDFNIDNLTTPTIIAISHADLDLTDRSVELDGVAVDSIIDINESGDLNRRIQVKVTGVDTSNGGYTEYTVAVIGNGTRDIRDNRECYIDIDNPVTEPSVYNYNTDYWLTQPDWGTVTSELYFDGAIQLDVNDAYGIEVTFQEAYISPDWDLLALSGGTGGGAGSGGTGIHISDLPPEDKIATPIWFNTSTGKTLTWYTDANSSQWVQDVGTGDGVLLGDNTITTSNIQDNAITNAKMADDSITVNEIVDLTITGAKISNTTIAGGKLINSTVTETQLANNSVSSGKILAGAVTLGKLGSNSVQSSNINDGSITNTKLGNSSVTGAKIAGTTITASNIQNATITFNEIAVQTIRTDRIANQAITATQIANFTITSSQMANNSINQNHIQDNSVTSSELADQTIMPTVNSAPIVERGSNANGDWIKWADGTMICTFMDTSVRITNTASGSIFQTTNTPVFTFPVAFITAPIVMGSCVRDAGNIWGSVRIVTTTTVEMRLFGSVNTSSGKLTYTATGKWK